MTAADLANIIKEIQATGDVVLGTLGAADPAFNGSAVVGEEIINLVGQLAGTALNAWSTASGVPITEASVAALLPDATPLSAPDA